jgi:hypothetical protein
MKKPTKPTLKIAVLAKCHSCMAEYADGINDCRNASCPLYNWMIRAREKPDLEWLKYNPRKKGLVRWEDCGRELTEEEKQIARDRLAAARNATKERDDYGF